MAHRLATVQQGVDLAAGVFDGDLVAQEDGSKRSAQVLRSSVQWIPWAADLKCCSANVAETRSRRIDVQVQQFVHPQLDGGHRHAPDRHLSHCELRPRLVYRPRVLSRFGPDLSGPGASGPL